ncbi:PH domain-containing protein [Maribacter algicola]|uniref:PH domain-containing protein n=1 Tax=Meishania litoralis TaxID=3434685 RepID=A0ACC7LGI2_9FLAO
MTKYRSKIGIGLAIFVFGILGGMTLFMIYQSVWSGAFVNLVVLAFTAHLFLNTYYTVNGNTLEIKSGFILHKRIDIRTINCITATNNPISAPAASLDRLEIFYDRSKIVLVSPKDKIAFIDHLKRINPKIALKGIA